MLIQVPFFITLYCAQYCCLNFSECVDKLKNVIRSDEIMKPRTFSVNGVVETNESLYHRLITVKNELSLAKDNAFPFQEN